MDKTESMLKDAIRYLILARCPTGKSPRDCIYCKCGQSVTYPEQCQRCWYEHLEGRFENGKTDR
jgi:hypothetical protein